MTSSAVAEREALRGTDGFEVLSSARTPGIVEEVWLGPSDEPAALAVQLHGGTHGLLLAEDVTSIDRRARRVVARPGARLLQLEPPRLDAAGPDGMLAASWRTTGVALEAPRSESPPIVLAPAAKDRSIAASLAILYGALLVIVLAVTALSFGVPWIVAGHPY